MTSTDQLGNVVMDEVGRLNLHMHTFFSFNAEDHSPSWLAWYAYVHAWRAAGIVDFDVLDGLEEFLAAGVALNLRTVAGIETRVFVPEFAGRDINSPGEPGIAYHMGVGMPQRALGPDEERFLQQLRTRAADRNQAVCKRVNAFLAPLRIDYAADVLSKTPNGNATERHMAYAYALKARQRYGTNEACAAFWNEKLGLALTPDGLIFSRLPDLIRAKTMKQGGVGYVQPDARSFPLMRDMNDFVLRSGGIPCLAWLDGESEGEQRIEELLDVAMESGVTAINIIPARNFTPGKETRKEKALQDVMALAESRDLLVLVGTEMNAPGQRYVDTFDAPPLAPHWPIFLKGAHIVYAHTWLQRRFGKGYMSEWAREKFPKRADRNAAFEAIGRSLEPATAHALKEPK